MELVCKLYQTIVSYACDQWKNHILPNIYIIVVLGLIITFFEFFSDFSIKLILDAIFSPLFFYMLLFAVQFLNVIIYFLKYKEVECFLCLKIDQIEKNKKQAEKLTNDLLAILFGVGFFIVFVSAIYQLFSENINFCQLLLLTASSLLMLYLLAFLIMGYVVEEIFDFMGKMKNPNQNQISKELVIVIYHLVVFLLCSCWVVDELKKLNY